MASLASTTRPATERWRSWLPAADGSLRIGDAPRSRKATRAAQKLLFYTERPIYRPGQKVYFKGIAREDLAVRGLRAGDFAL